jgi:hypothetical protein
MDTYINTSKYTEEQLEDIRQIALAAFYTALNQVEGGDKRPAGEKFNDWWRKATEQTQG